MFTFVRNRCSHSPEYARFYEKDYFPSQWRGFSLSSKMLMERVILGSADHVITLTEQGRAELARYGYPGEISVIPNGVDTSLFGSAEERRGDIDILFCGRIEPRKGSRAMVEVCNRLLERKPDIRICIVGYGEDEQLVNEQAGRWKENVYLAGKVPFDQVKQYYKRANVYVTTSYYEGLPGTRSLGGRRGISDNKDSP